MDVRLQYLTFHSNVYHYLPVKLRGRVCDSALGIANICRLDGSGFETWFWLREFSLLPNIQNGSEDQPTPLQWLPRHIPGDKAAKEWLHYPSHFSSSVIAMGCYWATFTFTHCVRGWVDC